MLWLALHFPQLSLDLFQADLCAVPHSPGKIKSKQAQEHSQQPIVILEDNKVCSRNTEAQQQGIELGCSLATAHSITTDLRFKHKDESAEQKRLRSLAQALYRFSSNVCIMSQDCIVLEIGASLRLFGNHSSLASAAAHMCENLNHTVITAVARTPKAALILARCCSNRTDSESEPSKTPDSTESLSADTLLTETLLTDTSLADTSLKEAPLTLAAFELADVKPDLIERFANMGIYTLGPLLELPSKELGRRFGPGLLTHIAQITGQLPDPIDPITPAPHFDQSLHLLKPVQNKNHLHEHTMSPMGQLAADLQQWLIAHQYGCEQLTWSFASSKRSETILMPIKFSRGKQNAHDLLRISILKLAQTNLPDEVITVSLRTLRLRAWENHSNHLFPNQHVPNQHGGTNTPGHKHSNANILSAAATELVDELNARFGEGSCSRITHSSHHTPEHAWQKHALVHLPGNKLYTKSRPTAAKARKKRPMWLFEPPRPVACEALLLLHGPERIQSAWWSDSDSQQTQPTCRDYYIARHTDNGAECWAFVDTTTKWYLHGYFG